MTVQQQDEHWVFGYGSLMWSRDFPVAEVVMARLEGFARSFCLKSIAYRGTVENPGLVLGLDQSEQAGCTGLAMRIDPAHWPDTLHDLRERELVTGGYLEVTLPVTLQDGREVQALTYVISREHDQYSIGLDDAEQARIIATAVGGRGPNADYLFNTHQHLQELGVDDPLIASLARAVRKLQQK